MNPWGVLGLDADGAALADVKRAYARLLKENRPDQNPEGFMRLRAAYEAAQRQLQDGPPHPAAPLPVAEPASASMAERVPATPSAAPELPPQVKEACEALRQAVLSKIRQKVRIAWAAYDEAARTHELAIESRYAPFIEAFEDKMPLLADCCTDERLLEHLQWGDTRLLRVVTSVWSQQGDAKRLDEFCVSLTRHRQLAESEIGALAMVLAALALGMWHPDQASRLAQRAFLRLPTSQRTELTGLVDYETMLGRLVAPLPQQFKMPWVIVLRYGDAERPWREMITREMLVALLRSCGPAWPGLPILGQRLKPESWLELKAAAEALLK